MISYDNIIENPLFIKWIFNPTIELDLYWDEYMEKHSQETQSLLELKSKLRNIRIKNENLSEEEKLKLAYNIIKKLDVEDKKNRKSRKLNFFLKYAAVAVLFFSVGAAVVYLGMDHEDLEH